MSLRLADTGVLAARRNLAITAALAELHRDGKSPDTLRFQHFNPSAIIGRHQSLTREVDLVHCRAHGIETARRITGGGAIYMGPGILGFELIADRTRLGSTLSEIAARLCTGLAAGLSTLGIPASFRPRNDIEVGGRKISGTGGYIDGRTLVFQGTVLIAFDPAEMANALVLPMAKRDRKGIAVLSDRVSDLRTELGTAPKLEDVKSAVVSGISECLATGTTAAELTAEEAALASHLHDEEIGTDAFVEGPTAVSSASRGKASRNIPAGIVEAYVGLVGGLIERVWVTGDFFIAPPRAILDLEATLAGVDALKAEEVARAFLTSRGVEVLGGTINDIVAPIGEAVRAAAGENRP